MNKHLALGLVVAVGVTATPTLAADSIIPRTVAMELITASW